MAANKLNLVLSDKDSISQFDLVTIIIYSDRTLFAAYVSGIDWLVSVLMVI